MSLHDWIAVGLTIGGWVCVIALSIDNWVHRQTYQGSEHGTAIRQLENEWKKFKDKQSEIADEWQKQVGALQIHLAEIEAHLKYTDRRIEDSPRPRNRQ